MRAEKLGLFKLAFTIFDSLAVNGYCQLLRNKLNMKKCLNSFLRIKVA